jgi:DNA-binding NarL/FixJ family response regulator
VTIRVLVADDHDLVRTGLAMILDAQPDIEVIAQAADGREAVALARRLKPDVCLFDIRMPGIDGIEATRQLAGPDVADPVAVVVITTFDLDEYVHGALKAGARGFLLKDAGPALLVQAIHAAADGDALIAPNVTVRLLETFANPASSRPAQPIEPLTDREEQVLLSVASGTHQRRGRRRALHQPLHREDAPGEPDAQARCTEPGRDRDVGLRDRPRPTVTRLHTNGRNRQKGRALTPGHATCGWFRGRGLGPEGARLVPFSRVASPFSTTWAAISRSLVLRSCETRRSPSATTVIHLCGCRSPSRRRGTPSSVGTAWAAPQPGVLDHGAGTASAAPSASGTPKPPHQLWCARPMRVWHRCGRTATAVHLQIDIAAGRELAEESA